jgi:hypothetical protein
MMQASKFARAPKSIAQVFVWHKLEANEVNDSACSTLANKNSIANHLQRTLSISMHKECHMKMAPAPPNTVAINEATFANCAAAPIFTMSVLYA